MTTISWPTYIVSHGGHLDTIRECQMNLRCSQKETVSFFE